MEQNSKSILIVDNDYDIQYMLSLRLFSAGYRVYGAANGVEALEHMENHPVDVVLTEHHMPKMDGFELLSICRDKWTSGLEPLSWSFLENWTTRCMKRSIEGLSRGFVEELNSRYCRNS
jgi:DNA-binding NarL/FixJ family response regulator